MTSFMEMALQEARAAGERGEVPVGCVLVRGGEVIARAGNRTIADRDPTAHADLTSSAGSLWWTGGSGSEQFAHRIFQAAALSRSPSFSSISDFTSSAERIIALA